MFFGSALILGGWGVVGWGRGSHLGPAEITSFSNWDFSQSNKHDTFWHFAWTRYFYILFSWAIAVSNFFPLEICKNSSLPLSTIIFTENNHAYDHFYKYIYLFQIFYGIKVFFSVDYVDYVVHTSCHMQSK